MHIKRELHRRGCNGGEEGCNGTEIEQVLAGVLLGEANCGDTYFVRIRVTFEATVNDEAAKTNRSL